MEELRKIDPSKVKKFTFDGIETLAKVFKVKDTDTVAIIFKFGEEYTKLDIRLDGIDAPESKSTIQPEREACRKGTECLKRLIENKIVKVQLKSFDKYGRTLGVVHTLEPIVDKLCCVNTYLTDYQYVRQYSGGTKRPWTKEELAKVGTKIVKIEQTYSKNTT